MLVSVPEGQDSTVQSWIPLIKPGLVQRQVASAAPLGQPRLGAKASMFLMHVCYVAVSILSGQIRSRSSAKDSLRRREEGYSAR